MPPSDAITASTAAAAAAAGDEGDGGCGEDELSEMFPMLFYDPDDQQTHGYLTTGSCLDQDVSLASKLRGTGLRDANLKFHVIPGPLVRFVPNYLENYGSSFPRQSSLYL